MWFYYNSFYFSRKEQEKKENIMEKTTAIGKIIKTSIVILSKKHKMPSLIFKDNVKFDV